MMRRKYIAKTMSGLENALASEISDLGAEIASVQNRAVTFISDLGTLYKINLGSRLTLRVLYPLLKFQANNPEQLYKNIIKFDWSKIIGTNNSFAIDSVVNSQFFKHSKYAALKMKDGIVDQIRNKKSKRPNVEVNNPDFRFNIHIYNDVCTVSLDAAGDSLHKRGYRISKVKAPLNEVLAAGMIFLSGWDGESDFIDPMCGSGTIVLEAALIACRIPPNIGRKHFGFMKWKSFDRDLFNTVKQNLISNKKQFKCSIIGNDLNKAALKTAVINARKADLDRLIKFTNNDFFEYKPNNDSGTLIMNPPYGERLKSQDENKFYKKIGDALKNNFSGFDAWVLSSNKEALKNLGLRTSRRIQLYNGALECKFHNYKLYKGSKKSKHAEKR